MTSKETKKKKERQRAEKEVFVWWLSASRDANDVIVEAEKQNQATITKISLIFSFEKHDNFRRLFRNTIVSTRTKFLLRLSISNICVLSFFLLTSKKMMTHPCSQNKIKRNPSSKSFLRTFFFFMTSPCKQERDMTLARTQKKELESRKMPIVRRQSISHSEENSTGKHRDRRQK